MPALRGENGLPGDFSGFYDETADVLAAADVLRAEPGVDPARLFLAGHSVGGTLALLAAMSTNVFRAAASFSGSPDARAFFRRFPDDIRFDAGDPLEFDMRSAVCFAESFKCPVLMLHGSGEGGSEAAVRLTVERARAVGLDVRRGVVEDQSRRCREALRAVFLQGLRGEGRGPSASPPCGGIGVRSGAAHVGEHCGVVTSLRAIWRGKRPAFTPAALPCAGHRASAAAWPPRHRQSCRRRWRASLRA